MKHRQLKKTVPYLVLTILAILFALPLVWILLASLDANAAFGVKIPETLTIGNYVEVLKSQANQRALKNGLLISAGQSLIVVVVSILAAYPLSRFELRCKRLFMLTILFMTALPMTAVMVPVYKLFLSMGLYNKLWGVILFMSATSLPYAIWMTKNFMDGVPLELEEAAKVDGATMLTGILKVIVPLMFPGICVVFIYTFSGSWGNFFVPYILLSTAEKMPASVQLYQFFGQNGRVIYGQLAAYSALYALPTIFLYVLSQSYLSKGFHLSGATKG